MSLPAPRRQRILAQASFDARLLLGNGEQLLVSLVLPALALVGIAGLSAPSLGDGHRPTLALAGALALAVISTAFTGQAIATAFDRRAGVLRLLGTTPLGADGLLAGRILAVLIVEILQVVVLAAVGLAMGARLTDVQPVWLIVALILGTATFVALALTLAGTVRAEGVLGLANLLWVVMLGLGVLVPAAALPGPLAAVAALTPGGALGDLLRHAVGGADLSWTALPVLVGWLLVGGAAATRLFRWSD